MKNDYKIVAIGAGFGGLQATIQAAMRGAKCALIDKLEVGGECLNFGCIPTKTIVRSIDTYRLVKKASIYGINVKGGIEVDFSSVMNRQKSVVKSIVERVHNGLRAMNIDFYRGIGTIISPGRVRVKLNSLIEDRDQEVDLLTENIIIGTGSMPNRLSIPGADLPGVLTNREILQIKKPPKSMVVIGCSYVGVEFATIFAGMGTKVSMLGRKNFLKSSDQKLAKEVRDIMINKQGIGIDIGLTILEIDEGNDGLYRVVFEKDGQRKSAEGEIVLMATGRSPFTANLFNADLKIGMDGEGIATNRHLQTNIPGIYAVGDVLNNVMLAFTAATEGEVAADNCLGKKHSIDYSAIPRCVFTYPELAGVGMTEEEAKGIEGLDFGVSEYPFKTTPMAEIMDETVGFTRLIFEKGSGKILGGHILGPHASELVAEMSLAVHQELTVKDMAYFLHFHPSLSENLQRAAKTGWFMEDRRG